jgi:GMP synthase-like glutamine amidotransferase
MHIHCFQHVPFETPGNIWGWAQRNGHSISYTYFYQPNPAFEGLDEAALLLVLGGAMNADEEDRFPWLAQEKEQIRRFTEGGRKVLGICLGSQFHPIPRNHTGPGRPLPAPWRTILPRFP